MDKHFDLEYQYQEYLKKMGISEDGMGRVEKLERKRAFMGGAAQIFMMMLKASDLQNEDDAANVLDAFLTQLKEYWYKEGIAFNMN